jgi:hypothetical protein
MTCHPILSTEARVALTLRLLGGLTTQEIARAFLATEPTIAQRIVRAKKTLAEAHVPFEVPSAEERETRLASKSSISSSMRDTPLPQARTSFDPLCARTRFDSAEFSRHSPRMTRKCTDSLH